MNTLKNTKILVVDDDPDLRDVVVEELTFFGAEAVAAENGNHALELLLVQTFDAVLSDMRMPDGDGRFLASKIALMTPPKPLVFIYSGYNDLEDSELKQLEIRRSFGKPLKVRIIADEIRKELDLEEKIGIK